VNQTLITQSSQLKHNPTEDEKSIFKEFEKELNHFFSKKGLPKIAPNES
jgi:hypothetical protein